MQCIEYNPLSNTPKLKSKHIIIMKMISKYKTFTLYLSAPASCPSLTTTQSPRPAPRMSALARLQEQDANIGPVYQDLAYNVLCEAPAASHETKMRCY